MGSRSSGATDGGVERRQQRRLLEPRLARRAGRRSGAGSQLWRTRRRSSVWRRDARDADHDCDHQHDDAGFNCFWRTGPTFFELNPASGGGTGPLLEFHGALVNAGQFGTGWTPLAAIQTGNGYEVAWGDAALNEYTVWNVGTNGDYTSSATGILSTATWRPPSSGGLKPPSAMNFAGVTAATPSPIGTNGELNELRSLPTFRSLASVRIGRRGVGPLLELNGGVVTKGQFSAGYTVG